MSLNVPNMYWHGNKERIMSLDFNPCTNVLVTGGSDTEYNLGFIKEWEINFTKLFSEKGFNEETMKTHHAIKFLGNIEGGHSSTVNCVKFSPNGQYLASGSDDRQIFIWEKREKFVQFGSNKTEIGWSSYKLLIGHSLDVTDLKWFQNSKFLLSGSIDNAAILWNIEKGKSIQRFDTQANFIQGVCVDPIGKYFITQNSDRTVRIWKNSKNKNKLSFYVCHVINLNYLKTLKRLEFNNKSKTSEENKIDEENQKTFRLFVDENTLSSRPDWSPDGSFCLIPAAQYQLSKSEKIFPCVLVFRRGQLNQPCFVIPTNNKNSICAKFYTKFFKLDEKNKKTIFEIDYKMIFAIATIDSVLIYTTEKMHPIAIIENIHLQILTDLTWNTYDGNIILAVSSSDGYCSFVSFKESDFGEIYPMEEMNKELYEKIKIEKVTEAKIKKNIMEVIPNTQQIEEIVEDDAGNKKKRIQPVIVQKFD